MEVFHVFSGPGGLVSPIVEVCITTDSMAESVMEENHDQWYTVYTSTHLVAKIILCRILVCIYYLHSVR